MSAEAYSEFIVYADESGDHGLERVDTGFPVFVLACCLFRKNAYINRLVPTLHGFKFRHFGHDGVILHERDIRKDSGAFSMLKTPEKKELFIEELTEIIRQTPVEIVAAVIRKDELVKQHGNKHHPYNLSLQFCLEQLFALMKRHGQAGLRTHVTCEARGKVEDQQLELAFRRICAGDNCTGRSFPFDVVIADKKVNCAGLQLADLIARPIGLAVARPEQANRAFEVIQEKLASDPEGKVERWGLKCFPEKPGAPVNPPRPQADRVSPIQEDTTVRQPGKQGSPG